MNNRFPHPFDLEESYVQLIDEKFRTKRKLAAAREHDLFSVFNEPLTLEEASALKWLYAYMPLNDLADYDGALFLRHVRTTLSIRDKVSWGRAVPHSLFLHFVLPYRVNNENIEDIRESLFIELFPRVQHLSMQEAILETNHWCHEKATYAGNDPRTVSPGTLIRTALGRCGEQSALAVAALRSLGIPARQVYTPRWAHCDSNHAWVEAWADGAWHYFGACEPEPRLNQGWFGKPARRAMLVHTRIPAKYSGPEEVSVDHSWYSELNLTNHYAQTKRLTVRVLNEHGQPTQAKVEIQVYNYAEFSTILSLQTNAHGEASFTVGQGDIIVHASSQLGWGIRHVLAEEAGTVVIVIGKKGLVGKAGKVSAPQMEIVPPMEIMLEQGSSTQIAVEFTMTPPPDASDAEEQEVTKEEKQLHELRVKQGAQIRADYEATFMNEAEALALAEQLSFPVERIRPIVLKARGNSRELAAFLREHTPRYGEWPLLLLEHLNDKDLTDTFRPTLTDHLLGAMPYTQDFAPELFCSYVLRPRVDYEMIVPYRRFFQSELSYEQQAQFRHAPESLFTWIVSWFQLLEDYTYYKGSATPAGSFRLKTGDRLSRDVMFVAIARSIGIPARLAPDDKRPQFRRGDRWLDAQSEVQGQLPEGTIRLLAAEESKYRINYSLARLDKGVFHTLSYPFGSMDVHAAPLAVVPGTYRLTTGTRNRDGSVLVQWTFFHVDPGQTVDVPLTYRKQKSALPVLGNIDAKVEFKTIGRDRSTFEQFSAGLRFIAAWIDPDREPSKHLLRELREWAAHGHDGDLPVLLMIGEDKLTAAFSEHGQTGLPHGTVFGRDDAVYTTLGELLGPVLQDARAAGTHASHREFPIVAVVDENGLLRYVSTGYKLGLVADIMNVLQALDEQ